MATPSTRPGPMRARTRNPSSRMMQVCFSLSQVFRVFGSDLKWNTTIKREVYHHERHDRVTVRTKVLSSSTSSAIIQLLQTKYETLSNVSMLLNNKLSNSNHLAAETISHHNNRNDNNEQLCLYSTLSIHWIMIVIIIIVIYPGYTICLVQTKSFSLQLLKILIW